LTKKIAGLRISRLRILKLDPISWTPELFEFTRSLRNGKETPTHALCRPGVFFATVVKLFVLAGSPTGGPEILAKECDPSSAGRIPQILGRAQEGRIDEVRREDGPDHG